MSTMEIICTHAVLLLHASIAVQVRAIVYAWGHPPDVVTSLNITVGEESHKSVAVALPVFAGAVLAVHWIVTFAGHVIMGA
jgi:hypothetical protein